MDNHQYSCSLDLPYPSLKEVKRDPRFARRILPSYIGPHGELSAISDYTYQSIIFEDSQSEFSDLVECVSIAEMRHFRILGRIIKLLGQNPLINAQLRSDPIDISNPDRYLQDVVKADIEGERAAIREYERIVSESGDPAIAAAIKRIILDEELHIKLFNRFLAKI